MDKVQKVLEISPETLSALERLAQLTEAAGANARWLYRRGVQTIEWALQFNPDELFNRPETLRLRGELHLESGQPDLAQADFRDSISLARSIDAKAWELRTATSLARLLAKQGHRQQARTMLAEIYNWFTEGFDTADLKDSKALLDELSD